MVAVSTVGEPVAGDAPMRPKQKPLRVVTLNVLHGLFCPAATEQPARRPRRARGPVLGRIDFVLAKAARDCSLDVGAAGFLPEPFAEPARGCTGPPKMPVC